MEIIRLYEIYLNTIIWRREQASLSFLEARRRQSCTEKIMHDLCDVSRPFDGSAMKCENPDFFEISNWKFKSANWIFHKIRPDLTKKSPYITWLLKKMFDHPRPKINLQSISVGAHINFSIKLIDKEIIFLLLWGHSFFPL